MFIVRKESKTKVNKLSSCSYCGGKAESVTGLPFLLNEQGCRGVIQSINEKCQVFEEKNQKEMKKTPKTGSARERENAREANNSNVSCDQY